MLMKGVVCKIEKPENMPVDKDGNRADLVLDPGSTIDRMNIGRLYEHYLNGSSRDVAKQIRGMLGLEKKLYSKEKLQDLGDNLINNAYSYLMNYYRIVSESQFQFFSKLTSELMLEHLIDVIYDDIYLYIPINNPRNNVDVVTEIEDTFKPTYGPVSYVGNSGIRCTTKRNVRIASMYIMLLDKIADEWSSVSSGRLQHFGILSPIIKSEKFAFPHRNSPVRAEGETEARIKVGYTGPESIAETMDRSNNPQTMRNISHNILAADQSGNIDNAVDRDFIPFGNTKPIQIVKHMLAVTGIGIKFEP